MPRTAGGLPAPQLTASLCSPRRLQSYHTDHGTDRTRHPKLACRSARGPSTHSTRCLPAASSVPCRNYFNTFSYLLAACGLTSEAQYPYTAMYHGGACSFNASMIRVQVTGFTDVPTNERRCCRCGVGA